MCKMRTLYIYYIEASRTERASRTENITLTLTLTPVRLASVSLYIYNTKTDRTGKHIIGREAYQY
jgi:hypothetical protein